MTNGDLHDGRPSVFVTVGTDYHRFDRLIQWVDDWMIEAGGASRARVFVQCGSATPPRHAAWERLVSRDEMDRFLHTAAAVVCHGGPASITECRSAGIVPIVVPRLRILGEHVDDHQLLFTRRLAGLEKIHLAATSDSLARLLDRAVAFPESFRLAAGTDGAEDAVAQFERLVCALLQSNCRPVQGRRSRLGSRVMAARGTT